MLEPPHRNSAVGRPLRLRLPGTNWTRSQPPNSRSPSSTRENRSRQPATAADVFTIMDGGTLPGRMRTLIGDFHRGLFVLAPSASYARDWADRMRTAWSRA